MSVVHKCCNSIVGMHQMFCPLYGAKGKPKLSPAAVTILLAATEKSLPGDGAIIKGAGRIAAARVMERCGLVRVAHVEGRMTHVYCTPEGKRLGKLLWSQMEKS